MRLGTFGICLIGAIDALSVWPLSNNEVSQAVLDQAPDSVDAIEAYPPGIIIGPGFDDGKAYAAEDGSPIVTPPQNDQSKGDRLVCTYPRMRGWKNCHGPESRGCWLNYTGLRNRPDKIMGINTNYEDPKEVPYGTVRRVCLCDIEMNITSRILIIV